MAHHHPLAHITWTWEQTTPVLILVDREWACRLRVRQFILRVEEFNPPGWGFNLPGEKSLSPGEENILSGEPCGFFIPRITAISHIQLMVRINEPNEDQRVKILT